MACKFTTTVAPHIPWLRNVAWKLLRDTDAAEDLVQETLLKAFRCFDRFEPGTNIQAWLRTMLRNIWVSEWRKAQKGIEVSYSEDVRYSEGREFQVHPPEECFGDEVRRALAKLPKRRAALMVRAYVDKVPHSEIGEEFNMRPQTIRKDLMRARQVLLKELRGYGEEFGLRVSPLRRSAAEMREGAVL